MLFYKAWLESRSRFFTGVAGIACVSILYVYLHPILIPQWIAALREPSTSKPAWLSLGIYDYRFYIWHFLFDYHLQEIWVLFAILLSFGGLSLEYVRGNVLFSLGLPVSRRKWILSRFLLALIQSFVISLVPVVVVPVTSKFFGLDYSMSQGIAHSVLMGVTGIFFIAAGILISSVLRTSFYLAISITLAVIGIPYMVIQEYAREAYVHLWIHKIDISRVMAGPWLISWSNAPWTGIFLSLTLSFLLLVITIQHSRNSDY